METKMMSWEEIERCVRDGQMLLWDGLSGRYNLDYTQIFPTKREWPDHLIPEPCKVNNREVFGVLKLTFPNGQKVTTKEY